MSDTIGFLRAAASHYKSVIKSKWNALTKKEKITAAVGLGAVVMLIVIF